MKCKAKIYYTQGKKRHRIHILPHWGRMWDETQGEICNGNIIATIKATEEPYYGGCSPTLDVSYKCNKCGNTIFPELPNEFNISAVFTEFIASLPEEPRATWQQQFDQEGLK